MNRILFYVHFNKNNELSEHVVYQLSKIRPLVNKLVLISNSGLSEADKDRLEDFYDKLIERENIGFDFAAWRDGMESISWVELVAYDSVTVMNDTCFGPIFPLKEVYDAMEQSGVDFWGMTDHAVNIVGMPGTGGPVPHHIQSYFQVFNRRVVKSVAFQNFWSNVQDYQDVKKVIQEYETKLTGILHGAGFSYDVYFNTTEYSAKNKIVNTYNYSELLPVIMLKNRVPLLKIKAFVHSYQWPVLRIVKRTDYPTAYIANHLKAMSIVNTNTLVPHIKHHIRGNAKYIPGYSILRQAVKGKPKP